MLLNRFTLAAYRVARAAHLRHPQSRLDRLVLAAYPLVKNGLGLIHGGGGISPTCDIGTGLRLPHHLNGVFLGHNVVIGRDVVIFQQVTLGVSHYEGSGEPVIGDRVVIYPGAKVVGPIHVGDDAVIGANAVVVDDVPAGTTAAGNPAKIVRRRGATDSTSERPRR